MALRPRNRCQGGGGGAGTLSVRVRLCSGEATCGQRQRILREWLIDTHDPVVALDPTHSEGLEAGLAGTCAPAVTAAPGGGTEVEATQAAPTSRRPVQGSEEGNLTRALAWECVRRGSEPAAERQSCVPVCSGPCGARRPQRWKGGWGRGCSRGRAGAELTAEWVRAPAGEDGKF